MSTVTALAHLNECSREEFVAACGPLFESSPWVAERTWPRRPFQSREALHREMIATVASASPHEKLSLIKAHPDLVGRLAGLAALGMLSATEQAAAGLDTLSAEEAERFRSFNRAYYARFGFPFVICARENRKESILLAFPERLGHSREEEVAEALSEIGKIAWLRLKDAIAEG